MHKKTKFNKQDHRSLALWATDCAEHVLPYFEKEYPEDDRPRKAIEAGRAWAHSPSFCEAKAKVRKRTKFSPSDVPMVMKEIRSASLASHAAARETDNASARAAARSAGQAVATVHVPGHARAAAAYSIKAVEAQGKNSAKEREWQYRHFPKHLSPIASTFLKIK